MSLNRVSQEELERNEAELYASLVANYNIQHFEEVNLIREQEYGKPDLPEEDTRLCEYSYTS